MRKIRVMLVDDESAIRNILKLSIPWEKYGMEVAGEADSGSEAINCIDTFMPDLLVVDIKMPFMDGIAFSKIVSGRYPMMKIIILTAYADFVYAQQCIEIGNVMGYLLKPVNPLELENYLQQFGEQYRDVSVEDEHSAQQQYNQPSKTKGNSDIIPQIDQFIEENYRNDFLNVGAVAEQFGYNANYLGSLYKKSRGESLSDYIFRVRMENAKILKRQGMKMYMVAKEVGISDPFYFSKCFRKYTGFNFSDFEEENK